MPVVVLKQTKKQHTLAEREREREREREMREREREREREKERERDDRWTKLASAWLRSIL